MDVVRHLVGIQAQAPLAPELAIRARAERLTLEDVDRARLEERSVVRTWAMRGTLHVIAAEDHGWLVSLTMERWFAGARRRLAQEGVPWNTAERAVGLIDDMLAADGPLTRGEIADRLRRRRVRTDGQAIAYLVGLAAARGVCCYGPKRNGQPAFALVRDWLGATRSLDRDDALAELAIRYLGAHGPAEPADLAAWSGLRAADARRAWGLVGDRLAEVETVRGTLWRLRSRRAEAPEGLVRLLPMFDEYLMGWRTREMVLPQKHERLVVPGGGMIRQAAVVDGVVAATWAAEANRGRLLVTVRPVAKPSAPVRRSVESEAGDVARFRGLGGDLVLE